MSSNQLAVVTGASSGIGYELAVCCARNGYNLVIAADRPEIHTAAQKLQGMGVRVEAIETDLATTTGVEQLTTLIGDRQVDYLLANAGHGLGKGFLDQEPQAWKHVINTNITGTLDLLHKIARKMRQRERGRILITGSIAGFMPGTYQAVYNASKAFLDSFSFALRHELKDSGVTVTCLMPGATETDFFERADLLDTKVGQSKKENPASVAEKGFKAMMDGDGEVISGWQNKMRAALGLLVSSDITAEMHKKQAAPGSGKNAA